MIYNMPVLDKDLMLNISVPYMTWAGPKTEDDETQTFIYLFGTDKRNLPWDRTVVGFYEEDYMFEAIWARVDYYAYSLSIYNVIGAITPNFSPWTEWDLPVRMYQIYRSRAVGKFFQEHGIKVVPDICIGRLDDLEYVFEGIPKGCPVSIHCHRTMSEEDITIKTELYNAMFRTLEPSKVWAYGPASRITTFPMLNDPRVEWIKPWGIVREELRRLYNYNPRKLAHKKVKAAHYRKEYALRKKEERDT